MSDEKQPEGASYAMALGLAWLLFPEEPREVIEERARNFVANMKLTTRRDWPELSLRVLNRDEPAAPLVRTVDDNDGM